jgi:signal transduction histidine kinase
MSQRMELMGMLAASAVHDLKNLLSIIIGYSEIVAEQFKPEDENYQYNKHITSTANTAVKVVKQILAFSWQKQDEESRVDLVELIDDILEILKVTTPTEIRISWQAPEEEILYAIDPTRFQQLIMNLCINAVHAMPEGGELKLNLFKESQAIIIKISDTGPGIPPEIQQKIFNPLFTTKEKGKGTGLGLFVVKQIIDENKGKIEIESSPETGTSFRIVLS